MYLLPDFAGLYLFDHSAKVSRRAPKMAPTAKRSFLTPPIFIFWVCLHLTQLSAKKELMLDNLCVFLWIIESPAPPSDVWMKGYLSWSMETLSETFGCLKVCNCLHHFFIISTCPNQGPALGIRSISSVWKNHLLSLEISCPICN